MSMGWQEALDVVVGRTRHERYRWLCSEANPDEWSREAYRGQVLTMATGEPVAPAPIRTRAATGTVRVRAAGCCGGSVPPGVYDD